MYQPRHRYKAKHFVKEVAITPDMIRGNRPLRRFMLVRRLVYTLNIAVVVVVLALFISGVI